MNNLLNDLMGDPKKNWKPIANTYQICIKFDDDEEYIYKDSISNDDVFYLMFNSQDQNYATFKAPNGKIFKIYVKLK